MQKLYTNNSRILAIAPSTRGFGFVVMEGGERLVNWGLKSAEGDKKNAQSLAHAKELITRYQPAALVLEDHSSNDCGRSPRVRALTKKLMALAKKEKVRVKIFTREQVRKTFFDDEKGTKHALAEIMAKRFPEELGLRLPPKRKPWNAEVSRMAIFDAAALAVTERLRT